LLLLKGAVITAMRRALAIVSLVLVGLLTGPLSALAGPAELSTSIEALTDNASIEGDSFVVDELNSVVRWEIIYVITNNSGTNQISNTRAIDTYGPELTVEYATASSGEVLIHPANDSGSGESVEWTGFPLGPWSAASLTVRVATSVRQGIQEYVSGGDYTINTGLQVTYRMGQGQAVQRLTGKGFRVKVSRPPQMRLTMSSPEVVWFIRKPGDYYAQAFTGTVTSDALVVMTFTDFTDLFAQSTGEVLPVYYSLQTEHPQIAVQTQHPGIDEWVSPETLSATSVEVRPSGEPTAWTLWQRVVLSDQGVGEYVGRGVVTFTILNVQDTFY
jgi:hypothetical protein